MPSTHVQPESAPATCALRGGSWSPRCSAHRSFLGLGATDLKNDEDIYSFAVQLMAETGDFLTPRAIPSESAPFFEKPPLKFWIVAGSIRAGLLPDNEFGHRFWDAVFGAIAFLYVFAIGRRLAGPLCGLVAVFVLFLHDPLLTEHGLRSNTMEAALVLSYCGAIFHSLAWSTRRDHRAGACIPSPFRASSCLAS